MIEYAVPCGCDHHGDHLGCDESCKEYGGGCEHPLGVVITELRSESCGRDICPPTSNCRVCR